MDKKLAETIKKMSQRDLDSLWSIYKYRCLTADQIYSLHYRYSERFGTEVPADYSKRRIKSMLVDEIIKAEQYGEIEVFFLTSLGINIVRECFDLAADVYYVEKNAVKRGYYRASELEMNPKLYAHQVATNQFMINFTTKQFDIYWKYYDEKHISKFRAIRPDALLSTAEYDFFIETDMGTEQAKQLSKKWEHYRSFLESEEFHNYEGKIIVLFTINGVSDVQRRINLIKKTIDQVISDKFSDKFDIIINTPEKLLEIIEYGYINPLIDKPSISDEILATLASRHNFSLGKTQSMSEYFGGEEFLVYARLLNDTRKIISIAGKSQEYIMDSYIGEPVSVMNKIANFSKINSSFKAKTGRQLNYVIIADLEDNQVMTSIYEDLKIRNAFSTENVYFSSIRRLKRLEFCKALVQFSQNGDVYEFKDWSLASRQRIGEVGKGLL